MAILPVSGVSFKGNRNANFSENENALTDSIKDSANRTVKVLSSAKAVPVMVLMTLNPALMNAEASKDMAASNGAAKIAYVQEAEDANAEVDASTYVMEPQQSVTKSKSPYGWGIFNTMKIKYAAPAEMGVEKGEILYTSFNKLSNEVDYVYLVSSDHHGTENRTYHPAEIVELVHHELGEKSYWEAVVDEDFFNKEGKFTGAARYGISLDEKTALNLYDMLTNKTKFKNSTYIKIDRTKSPRSHQWEDIRY